MKAAVLFSFLVTAVAGCSTGTAPATRPSPSPEPAVIPAKPAKPDETAVAARFRDEVSGLHEIRARGRMTDDEYFKGVDRAIDAMTKLGVQSDSAWLGRQLDILSGMQADGLLTAPEFEHARSLLVERYEK